MTLCDGVIPDFWELCVLCKGFFSGHRCITHHVFPFCGGTTTRSYFFFIRRKFFCLIDAITVLLGSKHETVLRKNEDKH